MDAHSATEQSERVQLRPADTADVAALARIEAATFSDAWPVASFRSLLRASTTRMTVAERDGEVLGYSVVIQVGDQAELANIAVTESARGQGVGARLLRALLDGAKTEGVQSMYLEVRESNAAARALYAAHGFTPAGRRRRYYRHPDEDALVLVWTPAEE
jgi:ribosomal-protein-alanine N-acetyltransferase